MGRMSSCWILIAFVLTAACGAEPSAGRDVVSWPEGDLFPLAEGRTWTWDLRAGATQWPIVAERKGGDRRGTPDVDYLFIYGQTAGYDGDVIKSIYAAPESGLAEFYLDLWHHRIGHEPPVALLPPTAEVGATWSWKGHLDLGDGELEVAATLRVAGVESVTTSAGTFVAVRVEERIESIDLLIVRWFAPEVGLVRLTIQGGPDSWDLEMALRAWQVPAPLNPGR
ncbi:MAG: hypothetical protein O2894_08480 [Planctomycetota bacterium]|nr:hypothetical protein [Planctomycetota bacterium]